MTFTKTFRRSGLATLAGVVSSPPSGVSSPVRPLTPIGGLVLCLALPVFLVSAFRHLMRGLLWRVGSRLLVSYLLLVAPLLFLVAVVYAGVWLVAAQVAGQRARAGARDAARDAPEDGPEPRRPLRGDRLPRPRAGPRSRSSPAPGPAFGDAGYDYVAGRRARKSRSGRRTAPRSFPRPWLPDVPSLLIGHDGQRDFFAAIERRGRRRRSS